MKEEVILRAASSVGLPIPARGMGIRMRDVERVLLLARRVEPSITKEDVWRTLTSVGYSVEPEVTVRPRVIPLVEVERTVADVVSDVLSLHNLPQSHRVREYLPFWNTIYEEALSLATKRLGRLAWLAPDLVKRELIRRGFIPYIRGPQRFWGERKLPGYRTSPFHAPKGVRSREVIPKEAWVPRFR